MNGRDHCTEQNCCAINPRRQVSNHGNKGSGRLGSNRCVLRTTECRQNEDESAVSALNATGNDRKITLADCIGSGSYLSWTQKKFFECGPDALEDYDLMELLLSVVTEESKLKSLIAKITKSFGSLYGVFYSNSAIIESVKLPNRVQSLVNVIVDSMKILLNEEMEERVHLNRISVVIDYIFQTNKLDAGWVALHLDARNRLLCDQRLPTTMSASDLARAMAIEALRSYTLAAILFI